VWNHWDRVRVCVACMRARTTMCRPSCTGRIKFYRSRLGQVLQVLTIASEKRGQKYAVYIIIGDLYDGAHFFVIEKCFLWICGRVQVSLRINSHCVLEMIFNRSSHNYCGFARWCLSFECNSNLKSVKRKVHFKIENFIDLIISTMKTHTHDDIKNI